MPLLRLSDIHLAYGPQVLLDKENLVINNGDRIGLLGRNGTGKSSFLKLLEGSVQADSGEIWRRPEVTVASLAQELPENLDQSVFNFVSAGLSEVGNLLQQFHQLSQEAADGKGLDKLERVQKELEARDGWRMQQKVDTVLTTLGLNPDTSLSALSGGWQRRVALARALVAQPDVLLLDEPTNHLDIPAIQWLEGFLLEFSGAVVVITHDRSFLQRVANQIMELDRGRLQLWQQSYQQFLEHRQQQLAAEEKANAEFDKKLAQEEVWIRQGIKARRTRNEGRVRALEKMRQEYAARRQQLGNANLRLNQTDLSGKIVVEAEGISHSFGEKIVIRDFSTTILRGDRIGLIGPNGAGKTTLLKILLGQLAPDAGRIKIGTRIELAYFDQLRASLDPDKSVLHNLAEGRDYIEIKGKSRHVMSYLQDFLFTPDRIRQPARSLSGGEQNRLILAQLFSKPANVLVLDEPTNDLDMETLELLEEILLEFSGTLILVSHDREFLDNVVTGSIVFEGGGNVRQYVGGYSDWIRHGGSFSIAQSSKAKTRAKEKQKHKPGPQAQQAGKNRLSYKLQRELDQLPGKIEQREAEMARLEQQISETEFYQQTQEKIDGTLKDLAALQAELEILYARWAALEQEQNQQQ